MTGVSVGAPVFVRTRRGVGSAIVPGRYLGVITDVRGGTIRFDGPNYPPGSLAALGEISTTRPRNRRQL